MFSLVCGVVAFVARHYVRLIKQEKKMHETEMINAVEEKLDDHKSAMKEQMTECSNNLLKIVENKNTELLEADKKINKEIDNLKDGMLSMQGRDFKNECHRLLKQDHIIDVKEYEALLADHIVYNKLGGNHEGDSLFHMVEAKYRNTIGIKEKNLDKID